MKRLLALGWGAEIARLPHGSRDVYNHPRVYVTRELTETGKSVHLLVYYFPLKTPEALTNMLPTLVAFLEKNRDDRESKRKSRLILFSEFYAEWARAQETGAVLPVALDISHHRELQEILDLPKDVPFTKANFNSLIAKLPVWLNEWRTHCDAALRLSVVPSIHINVDVLTLASTVWVYYPPMTAVFTKPMLLHYPEILEHRAARIALSNPPRQVNPEPEHVEHRANQQTNRYVPHFWICSFGQHASEVILACGLDPTSASREDMDKLGTRLICRDCQESSAGGVCAWVIFDWRAAVRHHTKQY